MDLLQCRDLRLARSLARRAEANAGLTLLLVLPAAPEEVAFNSRPGMDARFGEHLQTRALRILTRAFGDRLFVAAMAQPRKPQEDERGRALLYGAPIVYIHSKVSIFDDAAAIVSSANLNGRSLRWDTEAGLLLTDRVQVEKLRRKVMGHWLPKEAATEYFDPVRAVGAWRDLAQRNAGKAPSGRQGFVLPFDIGAAKRDAALMPFVPQAIV